MSDMNEIKTLIEGQGSAFEEFKKANDARLKAIEEKGFAPADLVEKVNTINSDLTAKAKRIDEIQKQLNRPGAQGGGEYSADDVEHKTAVDRYIRNGDTQGLREIERKAMNSTSDPDGGYLVGKEMEAAIDRVAETQGGIGRLARTVTIGTRSWQKRVKTSGMAMTRVAEGGTAGETTEPKYANVEIVVHPAEVEPWVFNETLEDADIDLAADLALEAAIAFAEGEGSEFVSGNGVGKARGITAYTNVANASYAWGKIGYIASGKAAAFASVAPGDKVISLVHALKPQYRSGAVMVMSDETLGSLRTIKDQSGSYYLFQPDPTGEFGGRVLGVPVVSDDNMASVTSGSYSIAYGNFQRAYTIVRRTGTALIRDNITSKGQTKFNFRRRFGGGITNFEAIKLMKFAAS